MLSSEADIIWPHMRLRPPQKKYIYIYTGQWLAKPAWLMGSISYCRQDSAILVHTHLIHSALDSHINGMATTSVWNGLYSKYPPLSLGMNQAWSWKHWCDVVKASTTHVTYTVGHNFGIYYNIIIVVLALGWHCSQGATLALLQHIYTIRGIANMILQFYISCYLRAPSL